MARVFFRGPGEYVLRFPGSVHLPAEGWAVRVSINAAEVASWNTCINFRVKELPNRNNQRARERKSWSSSIASLTCLPSLMTSGSFHKQRFFRYIFFGLPPMVSEVIVLFEARCLLPAMAIA